MAAILFFYTVYKTLTEGSKGHYNPWYLTESRNLVYRALYWGNKHNLAQSRLFKFWEGTDGIKKLGLRHYFTVTIRNFTVLAGLSMDHPEHMSINFQDPATAIAEGIIDLHNDIMTFLVPIFIFVCYSYCELFICLLNAVTLNRLNM